MNHLIRPNFLKRNAPRSVLGLALDGNRLEGVALRRSNGSFHVSHSFHVNLSLDPLTNDPELVGREILNHLELVGINTRHCVVAVPLPWILVVHTPIPDLPEADVPGFLHLEAERGFPTDVATLQVATSQLTSPAGTRHATFVGVPIAHLEKLEQALHAARLKPTSFSIDIATVQPPNIPDAEGVLALWIGQNHVGLQITSGGGIAALRTLEGALVSEDNDRSIDSDFIAREARITLGQLPPDLRESVKIIRILGPRTQAEKLLAGLRPRFEPAGLKLEYAATYPAQTFSRAIPAGTQISAAFSLAARHLSAQPPPFEFLPPKLSPWRKFASRYASGKWRAAGAAAAALLLLLGGAFGIQQWQLQHLRAQWQAIASQATELGAVQDKIVQYRPWFDESFRYLNALKAVTLAFPEDGSVTAKTLEIRDVPDQPNASTISVNGIASSYAALQKTIHHLGAIQGVSDLNVPTRGKAPIQFSIDFQLNRPAQTPNPEPAAHVQPAAHSADPRAIASSTPQTRPELASHSNPARTATPDEFTP